MLYRLQKPCTDSIIYSVLQFSQCTQSFLSWFFLQTSSPAAGSHYSVCFRGTQTWMYAIGRGSSQSGSSGMVMTHWLTSRRTPAPTGVWMDWSPPCSVNTYQWLPNVWWPHGDKHADRTHYSETSGSLLCGFSFYPYVPALSKDMLGYLAWYGSEYVRVPSMLRYPAC